jgi:hypothetical protein
MGFRVWGSAKNIILKGLEDVCVAIVSDTWLWRGQNTFACSDGHDLSRLPSFLPSPSLRVSWGSRVNVSCHCGSSFSWLTITSPTSWFFVNVADKGVKSEEQSSESKNASRDAGVAECGANYYPSNTIRWETFFVKGNATKFRKGSTDGRKISQNTHPYKSRVGHL